MRLSRPWSIGVVSVAMLLIGCPPHNTVPYPANPPDATSPDYLNIHGEATGGGLSQDAGIFQPGVPPAPALFIGPTGSLSLLASSGDQQSGIQKVLIVGQEKTCKWNGGGYTQVSFNGAKQWVVQTNAPSSGTVPEQSYAQTTVNIASELGTADRLELQFETQATNFGGLTANTAPISYLSTNATGKANPGACP